LYQYIRAVCVLQGPSAGTVSGKKAQKKIVMADNAVQDGGVFGICPEVGVKKSFHWHGCPCFGEEKAVFN
jgi:hypothetical protein